MSSKPRVLFLVAVLSVALFMVSGNAGVAQAQGVDHSLAPIADLSISAEARVHSSGTMWVFAVKANRIGHHPLPLSHDVKVRFSVEAFSPSSQTPSLTTPLRVLMPKLVFDQQNFSHGYYDANSMIWTIPKLPRPNIGRAGPPAGGGLARKAEIRVFAPRVSFVGEPVVARLDAEIIAPKSTEPEGFGANNAISVWSASSRGGQGDNSQGDAGVDIIDISDNLPGAGEATTLTVSAENQPLSFSGLSHLDYYNVQLDVQVRVVLSEGLTFAGTPSAPSGTTFNTTSTTTGIWDVGTLEAGSSKAKLLPVEVNLTADSLADLPLEKRCVTAEVIGAVPWFPFDLIKRENDITTMCLGEVKERPLPITWGDFKLFHFYPCSGVTSSVCAAGDTLKLVADLDLEFKDPSEFILHFPDRWSRDSNSTPTWSTENRFELAESQEELSTSNWRAARLHLTVTGPGGGQLPGSFTVDYNSQYIKNFVIVDTTKVSGDPFDEVGFAPPIVLYFGDLGTYVLTLDIEATKKSTNAKHTDSGTYTFHVGPMAELGVRDAGASPAVAGDQHAYTVMAVNNGPDEAPAVRVTGLPIHGVVDSIASHGQYDPNTGVWTIGKLSVGDYRSSGHANEGPTLTIITDHDAGTEYTPMIENTRDYCVRIQTGATDPANDLECSGDLPTGYTEHSASYYDLDRENNSTTITARAGTLPRQGHPDAPAGLTAAGAAGGYILQWEPVATVNGHPVTHYQVQRLEQDWGHVGDATGPIYLDAEPGAGLPRYRVRAVNWLGKEGPWSRPAPQESQADPFAILTGLVIASTPTANAAYPDTYLPGQDIVVDATFSRAVRVAGSPTLQLDIGDQTREAALANRGGTFLRFRYRVQEGDSDPLNGISIPRDPITLPQGATIRDADGNDAVLTFAGLGDQGRHKVFSPASAVDPQPPAPTPQPPTAPTAAPEPITTLTATPGNGQVTLEWSHDATDENAIIYQLWRADDPTWRDVRPEASGSHARRYTVTGLTNGTEYSFAVRGRYDDGAAGTASRVVQATPFGPDPFRPNNPPQFDRDRVWSQRYCALAGQESGALVARAWASDPDDDTLTYAYLGASGGLADYFTVSTVGGQAEVRVASRIPWDANPAGGRIEMGLEVTDPYGGRDNIAIQLDIVPQHSDRHPDNDHPDEHHTDPEHADYHDEHASCDLGSAGTASRSTASDEGGTSVLAAVRAWAGSFRDWWAGFRSWPDWGGRALAARP